MTGREHVASSASVRGGMAFEDSRHPALYSTLPGMDWHVWPVVRWPLLTGAVDAELATHAPVGRARTGLLDTARSAASGLAVGAAGLGRLPRSKRLLFVVGGVTVRPTPEGERNWLVDAYLSAAPDESVLLTDAVRERGRPRRSAFPASFTSSAALVRGELADRLPLGRSVDVVDARRVVDEIVAAFEPHLPVRIPDASRDIAVTRLLRADRRKKTIERIADRLQPDVVFMEDASYGSRGPAVEWLHRQGAKVVEPQHGWIGAAHGAYNFGAAMWDDELKPALPSELLLFGEFWGRDLAHPARQVVIGKPHLESAVAAARTKEARDRRAIVVSSVYRRDEIMELTVGLRDLLPDDWTVAFRPHPSERTTVAELYPRLVDERRIEFDLVPDVYESIGNSRLVVGTASTVLYEALAFDVDIIVIESPLTPMYAPTAVFGPAVSDGDAFRHAVRAVVSGDGSDRKIELSSIWAPDARSNAAAYVARR